LRSESCIAAAAGTTEHHYPLHIASLFVCTAATVLRYKGSCQCSGATINKGGCIGSEVIHVLHS